MRSFQKVLVMLIITGLLSMSTPVFADDSTADIEKRLNNLEEQVADLKQELWKKKQASTANITASSKDGFSIKSPDGNYKLQIGGYVQAYAREFSDNKKDLNYSSGFIARRVRLILQGTVARDFDFYIQPEFGYNDTYSTITSTAPSAYAVALQDAWIDYKYFPWATIKGGKFKIPFDLENLQDTRYTNFPEIGLTGNLSPQRDVGFQLGGSLLKGRLTYAVGIFGGAADHENFYGGSSAVGGNNNNRYGVGRIFVQPFKGTSFSALSSLGVGYAATYGKEKGTDLPTYITPGQAPVFGYNSGVSADGPQATRFTAVLLLL